MTPEDFKKFIDHTEASMVVDYIVNDKAVLLHQIETLKHKVSEQEDHMNALRGTVTRSQAKLRGRTKWRSFDKDFFPDSVLLIVTDKGYFHIVRLENGEWKSDKNKETIQPESIMKCLAIRSEDLTR